MIATCCICGFEGAVEEIRIVQREGVTAGRTRPAYKMQPQFWICDVCYLAKIV